MKNLPQNWTSYGSILLVVMGVPTYFSLLFISMYGCILFGILLFLRIIIKKNYTYLLFFTIFSCYFYKVLDYTLFQFQSLILLKYVMPQLMLKGQLAEKAFNVIPLITLGSADIKTSFLNILLFIPFGFGLPFITDFRMKKVVIIGCIVSLMIELLQLMSGFIAGITFRVADINDVIFNTLGVLLGYLLFIQFVILIRFLFHKYTIRSNAISTYILKRPQFDS